MDGAVLDRAELRHVAAHVVAVGIEALRLRPRILDAEIRRGIGTGARRPLPALRIVGEIGIDHDLVTMSSENISLLANGCICCTVRGDLIVALSALARQRDAGELQFDQIGRAHV